VVTESSIKWDFMPHQGDVASASLIELRRIADALEIIAGAKHGCDGENPENGQPCVLAEGHVGYHVPADGRKPWLDA
jgi:hypothetical protein